MPGVRLDIVPPELIRDFWPQVTHLVRKGCSRTGGELNEATLKASLEKHDAALWLVSSDYKPLAIIITRNEMWSGEKVCRIVLLAGSMMSEWDHLESEFHDILKNDGVVRVRHEGRGGWERARMTNGYRKVAVVMERTL